MKIFSKIICGENSPEFKETPKQHKDYITKAVNFNIASVSFDFALSSHVFENPSHKILFHFFNDICIKQVVREAIEIRLKNNNNISLNRDLGEYSLNALYTS